MKLKLMLFTLAWAPVLAFAAPKAPDCHSWPMNIAKGWLKNAGIADIYRFDETRTKVELLASEKKGKDLYTQVYSIIFYSKDGKSYHVITKSDASNEECSMGGVDSYLVEKSDKNY